MGRDICASPAEASGREPQQSFGTGVGSPLVSKWATKFFPCFGHGMCLHGLPSRELAAFIVCLPPSSGEFEQPIFLCVEPVLMPHCSCLHFKCEAGDHIYSPKHRV